MNFKKILKSHCVSLLLIATLIICFPEFVFASTWVWTQQTGSGLRTWSSIAIADDGLKMVAVVNGGYIYNSVDGGVTWIERTGTGTSTWSSVASSADGMKLAVTSSGNYIYTSSDAGASWSQQTGSGSRTWSKIVSSSDGTKIAAIATNLVYTSNDSGITWTQTGLQCSCTGLLGMAGSSDGTKLIALTNASAYQSSDSGATWTLSGYPIGSGVQRVTSSSDGTKLAITKLTGGIYTSIDSGTNWTLATSSTGWRGISSSGDGSIIIGSRGVLYISTDGGATFTAQSGVPTIVFNIANNVSGNTIAIAPNTAGYIYTGVFDADPTVSLTAPLTGTTVHGSSVALTANATDAVSVAGVQFKLDTNTNIASEDTTSTYGVTWDSTAIADGSHTLIAVARDSAGNYATSTAISVTVDNTGPVLSSISAGTPTQTGTSITWNSSEAATTQVEYGTSVSYGSTSVLNTATTTSHTVALSGLTAGTTYHYRVISTDNYGNTTTSSDQTFTTVSAPSTSTVPVAPTVITQPSASFYWQPYVPVQSVLSVLPSPKASHTFTRDLETGTRHQEVLSLQKYLNTHGFLVAAQGPGSPGNETTMFGSATQAALIKFQRSKGIYPAIGYFGPLTKTYINTH